MDFVSKAFNFKSGEPCIIIGEIGVNHSRQKDLLFRLIDEGIAAGLDIIKLQHFVAADEISQSAESTQYQHNAGEQDGQLAMAKRLELPDEWLVEAYNYCKVKGVGFLCTAFDHSSVDFIADKLKCRSVRVPSPDITNKPLIQHLARKFDGLLISTGASLISECAQVLDWVSECGKRELAMMHCLSEYPAPLDQVNLKAIVTMREVFGIPVGYSDHTTGSVAAIVAAGLGAAMVEKHYTLDKSLPGPDHQASLDINELKAFVTAVRQASSSLGNGIKRPAEAEIANRPLIRKSLVCAMPKLEVGTRVTPEMCGVKRPWIKGAVEPFEIEKIVGMTLRKEKGFDEAIMWSDFS